MLAVVTGMIATMPFGGVAWDYGQYALGLEELGFDVFYLEDVGMYTYDPHTVRYTEDPTSGVGFLRESLKALSPSLGDRWHFRDAHDGSHGIDASEFAEIVATADVLINVSGACILRQAYMSCPKKAMIDTDPGWNHYVMFPRLDAREKEKGLRSFRHHDYFFTYAERIGQEDCSLPDLGIPWIPTRPPVVIDRWSPRAPGSRWTTVLSWDNYRDMEFDLEGWKYGSKEREFTKIAALPSVVDETLEIALGGVDPPAWDLLQKGWALAGSMRVTSTLDRYRRYIETSRGELSVAKNVYVETGSGWFSCRSACYLAAHRPVVLQDTGFTRTLPTGKGLLAFTDLDGAAEGIRSVEADYEFHCEAAAAIAEEYLDASKVLTRMLGAMEVG